MACSALHLELYPSNGKEWRMMHNAWMQANHPVKVGVMGASLDGQGFEVKFEDFKVKHLPDMRCLKWLGQNK